MRSRADVKLSKNDLSYSKLLVPCVLKLACCSLLKAVTAVQTYWQIKETVCCCSWSEFQLVEHKKSVEFTKLENDLAVSHICQYYRCKQQFELFNLSLQANVVFNCCLLTTIERLFVHPATLLYLHRVYKWKLTYQYIS